MSAHAEPIQLDPNRRELFFRDKAAQYMRISFIVGIICLAGAVGVGAMRGDHFTTFSFSYLVAYVSVLAVVLGALFFVILQHLVRAGWSVAVRRLAEIIAGTMPVMFLLALPIIVPVMMGSHVIYEWVDQTVVSTDHLLQVKSPYLNPTFFLVRMAVYFGLWILAARMFGSTSVKQDESGDPKLTWKLESRAPLFMVGFALTLTFAAVDLIMSVVPHWYSTIIGVYYFGTAMMTAMATMILLARFLQKRGRLVDIITTEHYHDLGKLMFAFLFFWGYIAFSQFMLIWYANMPEGTSWYQMRFHGQWIPFSIGFLILGHFVIPFLGLISRQVKRNAFGLSFWAVWLLVMHWADMYYLIVPAIAGVHKHGSEEVVPLCLTDPLSVIGIGAIFVGAIFMGMRKNALVPLKDPRLHESLAFENI